MTIEHTNVKYYINGAEVFNEFGTKLVDPVYTASKNQFLINPERKYNLIVNNVSVFFGTVLCLI